MEVRDQGVSQKLISRIYGYGRGHVFSGNDLADLGEASAIRQALSRLEKTGTIRRLARGLYEYPRFSELLQATAPADPDKVARAIARTYGWTIVPTGETALNGLGLSTQVPAAWEYLSDGPSKSVVWLGGTIHFKKRTNRETSTLSPPTALVVQALKALGQNRITPQTLETLSRKLDEREWVRALKEAKSATEWVYSAMKKAAQLTEDLK